MENLVSKTDKTTVSCSTFYGDLVTAVAFTVVAPIDGWKASNVESHDPKKMIAVLTFAFGFVYCALCWLAYLKDSRSFSFAAMLSGLWYSAFVSLQQWPYEGECIISYQLQGIVFGCVSNTSLSLEEQLLRLILVFSVGSYVSIQSPFSVYKQDALPILGGTILLALLCLIVAKKPQAFRIKRMDLLAVNGARWVLAAIYMYHTACDLLLITSAAENGGASAREKLTAIVKAAFIACVGVVATGTIQSSIDHREKLEILVQKRNKELYMVELALQASKTAIAITDSDRKIIWVNAACKRLCGTAVNGGNASSLSGRLIMEALSLDNIDCERKLADAFSPSTSSNGKSIKKRDDEIFIDNQIFHMEVSAFPDHVETKANKMVSEEVSCDRFLVVLNNITADRARENAEKIAREEAMLAKAMSDSMVTLTHELRTPMQGIMGVTSMLIQDSQKKGDKYVFGADAIEPLKLIMASSGLLLNLINNLLDVKKVHAEMMDEFPLKPIRASDTIKDTIDFCQPLASISKVSLVAEYSDGSGEGGHNDEIAGCMVMSNALRLQQILINLVSNALKYTRQGSEIRISIKPLVLSQVDSMIENSLASSRSNGVPSPSRANNTRNDLVLLFSVSDFGPGIAPYQANRLFRRFARLEHNEPRRSIGEDSKSDQPCGQPSGTGLGLHLCQLFVQRMKGEIWATNNRNGEGSTFSFFLPLLATSPEQGLGVSMPDRLAAAEGLDVSVATDSMKPSNAPLSTFEKMRILLVDDVLINRKVLGRMLRNVGTSEVVTVASGESALRELLANGPYSLVITDLQMPGMSGTDLCRAILDADTTHEAPVVVGLTADTSPTVAEKCAASGMADVLYKPITVSELREYFASTAGRLRPGVWFSGSPSVPVTSGGTLPQQ